MLWILEGILDFGPLNGVLNVLNSGDFWICMKCIPHYKMIRAHGGQRVECGGLNEKYHS